MDSFEIFERFERVRGLLAIAVSNHTRRIDPTEPMDRDFAIRRYVEAVDALVEELQALEAAGVLAVISDFLFPHGAGGAPLQ